uniref:Uncharacterized protein n=1 Tax=Hyaloperonospora arabidopsidis (strain Emoy2) TaxID=559515 RepID=M4C082_HYAAE
MRDGREVEGFESDLFECRNCGSSRKCYRQWRREAVVDLGVVADFSKTRPESSLGNKCNMRDAAVRVPHIVLQRIWQIAGQHHRNEQLRRQGGLRRLFQHRAVREPRHGTSWPTLTNWLARRWWNWALALASADFSPLNLRRAHTALTDGNDIVLELLQENAETNADPSKVQVLLLLWGEAASAVAFERAFPHPVDVLIGADVVCWPNLVKPMLQTIKYLLLRSRDPLNAKFCCGFVCRAQSTEELLYKEAVALGFRFERVQSNVFLPSPRTADVTSNRELQLIVFTLDPHKANWNQPMTLADRCLKNLQTAC